MKRINLGEALEQCADDTVLQRIAARMGLPAHAVAHVFGRAAPMLTAALAARAADGREDTRAVFDALMSRESNARIGSECAQRVETTAGLKDLEQQGHLLATRAIGMPVATLSDHVAAQTGVPTQPANALCGMTAAMLAGVIKHHVLLEQGDVSQLPGLLASQLPTVASGMEEGVAALFGYPHARAFADTVAVRLAAVAADFHPRQVLRRHPDDEPNADARTSHAVTDETRVAVDHSHAPGTPAPDDFAVTTLREETHTVAGSARTDMGGDPAAGQEAEAIAAQQATRFDVPQHARFAAGKVYANEVRYTSSMATPAYAAASHPGVPAEETGARRQASSRGSKLWPLFMLLALVLVALAVWAKRHTWAETLAVLTPTTSTMSTTSATSASSVPVAGQVHATAASDDTTPPSAGHATAGSVEATGTTGASGAFTQLAASGAAALPANEAQAADARAPATGAWLAARTNASGAPAVQAVLDRDDQRQAVVGPLLARFGKGHFSAALKTGGTGAGGAGASVWLSQLDALSSYMAVPGAELTLEDHRVMLGGLPPENAEAWRQRLQQTLGPAFDVEVFDRSAAVSHATDSFLHAMSALLQTDSACDAQQAAAVLNRQVIDFAAGDDRLPPSATENLSMSAQLMKACAARNQALRLAIAAHADRADDGNGLTALTALTALTQRRADAIRGFLVNAGVPVASLVAQGYGADRAVAGTLTAAGRFANRRIEFVPL